MKKIAYFMSSLFAIFWIVAIFVATFVAFIPNQSSKENLIYSGVGGDINQSEDYNSYSSGDDLSRIYSSPMRNYYYNLRDNFGYNQRYSCGYVALGMMLTYYDSYYDDKLVPENYDAQAHLNSSNEYSTASSPGSIEVSIAGASDKYIKDYILNIKDYIMDIKDYINILVNQYSDTSLHAKLVSIGNSLGYTPITDSSKNDLNIHINYLERIAKKYIETNESISNDRWVITKYINDNYTAIVPNQNITYSELMLNNIKTYLRSDIPVLVLVTRGKDGHFLVAYDYDEENDIVYGHYGWRNTNFHSNILSDEYPYVYGYIVLSTKDPHSHNNNYIVNNKEKCSCSLPNHKHEFSSYKSQDAEFHKKYCHCGYIGMESHRFTKHGTGALKNYLICGDCGYAKLDDGTLPPIINMSIKQGEGVL